MADSTTTTTSTTPAAPAPAAKNHDTLLPDSIEHDTRGPLLAVDSPLGGFSIPSPHDLLHGGMDIACKLFEADAHSSRGHTYQSLMAELAKYTEGDPSLGPLDVTRGFTAEDPAVPEYVKFGPESPMTQQLMVDSGVVGAIDAYYLDGADQTASKFRVDDFIRETVELTSMVGVTEDGRPSIDIGDAVLTEHQLGSYTVKLCETPDQQLMVVVFNNTGLESATRNPITQESLFEDKKRSEPGGFGTVHQAYYWFEPLRECLP